MTVRVQLVLAGLERRRPEHVSIEVGFRWFLRDREIAGGVLGGGLAYRLFFWGLALTLLTCGGLGVAASSGSNIDTAMKDSGLTSAVADIVASAAQQSEAERWWLLAVGAYSTLWFGWSFLRSLRLVHAAAWRVTLPRLRNAPLALAAVLAAPCVLALLSVAAGWVPARGRRRHRGCSRRWAQESCSGSHGSSFLYDSLLPMVCRPARSCLAQSCSASDWRRCMCSRCTS